MRENYDQRMMEALKGFEAAGEKPRLLLHVCCAPCGSAVMERLSQRLDITLFYYNPNIDTLEEHDTRASEMLRLKKASGWAKDAVIIPYDPSTYMTAVQGLEKEREGGARCRACFSLRLQETARYAKAHGYDLFTTTLTISPMKNAALLNQLGEAIAEETGVPFLNSDFKKQGGYQRSTELSKQFGLYRQDYCGCVFSKRESLERKKQAQNRI